jgi:signal recognition particle GTPase
VQDVNQLVKQFREMQKMMKQMGIMGRGGKRKKGNGRGMLPKGLSDMFGGMN